jgi:hypothetical protein
MASKEWIARVKNDAARAARLDPGATDATPLLNDDTLTAERERLTDAAPAHLRDRIYDYIGDAARAYTDGLLTAIGNAATTVGHRLELRTYDADAKLSAAAEAQDLATLAIRVYSRGAAFIHSSSNPGYDTAQRVAADGVKYALSAYVQNNHTDEFRRYADAGKFAEAVFGTMPAFHLLQRISAGAFKIGHVAINHYFAATLDPAPDDTIFSPPMVVGWAYPGIEKKNGVIRAVARAQLFAVLPDSQHSGLLRERTNERLTALLKDGSFRLEDDNGRVFGYPATLLRVTFGSGYGATPTFMRVVPLGDFAVKHVTRDSLSVQAMNDYADLLRNAGYKVSYGGLKKDAEGPTIGKGKDGYVKWISPDPFAKG